MAATATVPSPFPLSEDEMNQLALVDPFGPAYKWRQKNVPESAFKPPMYPYIKSLLHNWTYFAEVDALVGKEKARYEDDARENFFANDIPVAFSMDDDLPQLSFRDDEKDIFRTGADEDVINDFIDFVGDEKEQSALRRQKMVDPMRSQFHYGQMKLHLSEVILLNEIIANVPNPLSTKFVFVYAGFAPGHHIHILMEMYNDLHITWVLYDPRADEIKFPYLEDPNYVPPKHKVEIYSKLFLEDDIKRVVAAFPTSEYETVFVTDIRQSGGDPKLMKEARDLFGVSDMTKTLEEQVVAVKKATDWMWNRIVEVDNGYQHGFVDGLRFDHNLIKFRFPYDIKEPFDWYDGKIFYQLYGPDYTTETRLYISKKKGEKDFKRRSYDVPKFEGHMGYFNRFIRKRYYAHNYDDLIEGICHCYDCTRYIDVMETYYDLMTRLKILPAIFLRQGKTRTQQVIGIMKWLNYTLVRYSESVVVDGRVVMKASDTSLYTMYRNRYIYGLKKMRRRAIYHLEADMAEQEISYNLKQFFRAFYATESYRLFPKFSYVDRSKEWLGNNRVGFTDWFNEHFKDNGKRLLNSDKGRPDPLGPQQLFVRQFINSATPYRGILVYHNMGSGKTGAAIASAEALLDTRRKIYVLSKESLRSSFMSEVKKWGHAIYRGDQATKWQWSPLGSLPKAILATFLPLGEINKMKGLWLPSTMAGLKKVEGAEVLKKTGEMTRLEKKGFDHQIEMMIENRYEYLVYNGTDTKFENLMAETKKQGGTNPFDDSIVIVDEVHNYIARVTNKVEKGAAAHMVYQWLKDATRAKVICLTATPISRYPWEAAYLINMLKGTMKQYTIRFDPKAAKSIPERDVKIALAKFSSIDTYSVDMKEGTIVVTTTPPGFSRDHTSMLRYHGRKVADINIVHSLAVKQLREKVGLPVIDADSIVPEKFDCLPEEREEFDRLFVGEDIEDDADIDGDVYIKNQELFQMRIHGAVSYFDAELRDKHLYAKMYPIDVKKIPMSSYQVVQYASFREVEANSDRQSLQRGKASQSKSTYRADSLMASMFAAPTFIKKESLTAVKKRLALEEADDSGAGKEKARLDVALLTQLWQKRQEVFSEEGLLKHAPKFLAALKMIQANPKLNTLIFSQWTTFQGTRGISMMLDYHGFEPFTLGKGANGKTVVACRSDKAPIDPVTKKPKKHFIVLSNQHMHDLKNIYSGNWNEVNDDLKESVRQYFGLETLEADYNLYGEAIGIVIISPKSAEGISLFNIRQIIIMNPDWKDGIIKQITGRAYRTYAHRHFPPKERYIHPHLLLAVVDREASDAPRNVMAETYSSDEAVYTSAKRKQLLVDRFNKVLVSSSVDCRTYEQRAEGSPMCYSRKGSPTALINHPNIEDDKALLGTVTDNVSKVRTKGRWLGRQVPITIKGHAYMWSPETGLFFEDMRAVGKIFMTLNAGGQPSGSVRVELFDLPIEPDAAGDGDWETPVLTVNDSGSADPYANNNLGDIDPEVAAVIGAIEEEEEGSDSDSDSDAEEDDAEEDDAEESVATDDGESVDSSDIDEEEDASNADDESETDGEIGGGGYGDGSDESNDGSDDESYDEEGGESGSDADHNDNEDETMHPPETFNEDLVPLDDLSVVEDLPDLGSRESSDEE